MGKKKSVTDRFVDDFLDKHTPKKNSKKDGDNKKGKKNKENRFAYNAWASNR